MIWAFQARVCFKPQSSASRSQATNQTSSHAASIVSDVHVCRAASRLIRLPIRRTAKAMGRAARQNNEKKSGQHRDDHGAVAGAAVARRTCRCRRACRWARRRACRWARRQQCACRWTCRRRGALVHVNVAIRGKTGGLTCGHARAVAQALVSLALGCVQSGFTPLQRARPAALALTLQGALDGVARVWRVWCAWHSGAWCAPWTGW